MLPALRVFSGGFDGYDAFAFSAAGIDIDNGTPDVLVQELEAYSQVEREKTRVFGTDVLGVDCEVRAKSK